MNTDQHSGKKSAIVRIIQSALFVSILIIVCFSCATPIAPTGGPPDREGPVVIETTPASGTVNFSGDEVRFTFDKFVDRGSVRQNISIEPDLAIPFEVNFNRKTVIVSFDSDLPDNTTIIIKLGEIGRAHV